MISHGVAGDAPILVAANREERFNRPALPPQLQPGRPRVLCGIDRQAGGTWLGVNEHGLLVAVTNRPRTSPPPQPPSRGLLCRALLECPGAAEAAQRALEALGGGRYDGANYVCLDPQRAIAIHAGDRLGHREIEPGLHLMANGDLDDADDHRLARARTMIEAGPPTTAAEFLARTAEVCAHGDIVVREADRGTVSSDQVALTADGQDAVYRHAPGPPDRQPYDDYSQLLRGLLDKHAAP
ncbi:MAG: NRDE family protein [Planctomycetota bacterium]